jgi:hypothetical protein
MSKEGSKKEFILTLYLKKYPEIIEDLIGIPIEGVRTEVSSGAKYIDLYAVNRDRKVEIYVENQIKPSDRSNHLKTKLTPLINNIAEGYLIWIAPKFQKEHIEEVKKLLRENPQKYINFYAAETQQGVLKRVEYLNTLYELDVWQKLDIINEVNHKFNLVDRYIRMPKSHIGKAYIGEYQYDFSRDDDIKEYLAEQLCKNIPCFLNFHIQKKHLLNDRILKIGAGLGEVTYFCSALDMRSRAIVGIRFEHSKQVWYQYFKQNEMLLLKNIGFNICFNDKYRTISYHFRSNRENIPAIVDHIVEVFEKFILFFSPFTYGRKLNNIVNHT